MKIHAWIFTGENANATDLMCMYFKRQQYLQLQKDQQYMTWKHKLENEIKSDKQTQKKEKEGGTNCSIIKDKPRCRKQKAC